MTSSTSSGSIPSSRSSCTKSRSGLSYTARTNTPSPLRYATSYSTISLSDSPASTSSSDCSDSPEDQEQPKDHPKPQPPAHASFSIFPWSKYRKARPTRPPIHSQPQKSIRSSINPSEPVDYSSSVDDASTSDRALSNFPGPPRTSGPRSRVAGPGQPGAVPIYHTWQVVNEVAKVQKANDGTHAEAPAPHPARRHRDSTLKIHPLLAHTPFQRPIVTYDVSRPPSLHSLVDVCSRSNMSAQALAQPASNLAASRLVLTSSKFPWPVVATSAQTSENVRLAPRSCAKSSDSSMQESDALVTVLDLLHAVHITLTARVTPAEWVSLGHGSRAQKQILQAYERRCVQAEGGWEEGVRRIDYLLGRTLLVGVEMYKKADKQDAVGRLVFSSP